MSSTGWLGLPDEAIRELSRRLGGSVESGHIQVHYDNDGAPRKVSVRRVWRVDELVEADQDRQLRAS